MSIIKSTNHNKESADNWSIESVFRWSIWIKLSVFILIVVSFWIVPQTQEAHITSPSKFLSGYYQYDGSQFREICQFGYLDPSQPYPQNIQNFAFFPGEAWVNCAGRAFHSVIALNEWGAVIANSVLFVVLGMCLKLFLDTQYADIKLKKYLWLSFFFFPMSMFLHLNYSEIGFLIGTFLTFYFLEKQQWGSIAITGLISGFFRITALPLGLLGWLRLTYQYLTKKIAMTLAQYLIRSLAFASYGVGTVVTFGYYYWTYGDFWMYFRAQQTLFGRADYNNFFSRTWSDITGLKTYWDTLDWSHMIDQTGFTFYTASFRYWAYLAIPLVIFVIGLVYLIVRKRYYWALVSLLFYLAPMITSTNSINRYLLQSFPILFALFEIAYFNKYVRWVVMALWIVLFGLFLSLHMRGFWVA
jgi:hypothetical protein